MSSIHNEMALEYDRKRQAAFDALAGKKAALYERIPRLSEIEREISLMGIKYNKMILLGAISADASASALTEALADLNRERTALLMANDYPPDYLEPAFQCALCRDTGYIMTGNVSEKCSCYRQRAITHLYEHSNIKFSGGESFATFDESYFPEVADESRFGIKTSPRSNIMNIKDRCIRFTRNFQNPDEKSLFFSGPAGTGKTFMSCCIAKELMDKGHTVLYQTAPALFNTISAYKMNAYKNDDADDEGYRHFFDVELLIIDDLGTEPQSAARYAELLTILDTRLANNFRKPCKTVISTNLGVSQLSSYYDERVASRIIGGFDLYRFAGEDIRLKKKLQGGRPPQQD